MNTLYSIERCEHSNVSSPSSERDERQKKKRELVNHSEWTKEEKNREERVVDDRSDEHLPSLHPMKEEEETSNIRCDN